MKRIIKNKFKVVFQDIISRLNLISREEFDIQNKILKKTREKVDILNNKLEDLLSKSTNVKNNE